MQYCYDAANTPCIQAWRAYYTNAHVGIIHLCTASRDMALIHRESAQRQAHFVSLSPYRLWQSVCREEGGGGGLNFD